MQQQLNKYVLADRNRSLGWFFLGLAVGSLTAILFDPVQGRRRQALVKDQGVRFKNNLRNYSSKTYKDLRNRAQGAINQAFLEKSPTPDDEKLMARVRSEFGRFVRHPKAITTTVRDGVVTLSGAILADEIKTLINCVKSVPGVEEVIDQLEVYESAEGVSSLQGEGPKYLQ